MYIKKNPLCVRSVDLGQTMTARMVSALHYAAIQFLDLRSAKFVRDPGMTEI